VNSTLHELKLSLGRWLLGRGKPCPAADWNRKFAAGECSFLDSEPESLRFVVAANLLDRLRPSGLPILDVGCGTGTLLRHLGPASSSRYVGLDVSSEALVIASSRAPVGSSFVLASADEPFPYALEQLGPFGAIVLSEVLYYLRDPVSAILRYKPLLAPGGILLISLWRPFNHSTLRLRLTRHLSFSARVSVASSRGAPWKILVGTYRDRSVKVPCLRGPRELGVPAFFLISLTQSLVEIGPLAESWAGIAPL